MVGALVAGVYGVVHDQITFSIGPEYFYKFKFQQFAYADFGLHDRIFAAEIGFLATWWVGMIVGWILAKRCLPGQDRPVASKQIIRGFCIVFAAGFLAAVGGYLYGLFQGPEADYSAWRRFLETRGVTDHWSFLRVAYIHNASYLGGLVGLLLTFVPSSLESSGSGAPHGPYPKNQC